VITIFKYNLILGMLFNDAATA